jgi:hypothetical protein
LGCFNAISPWGAKEYLKILNGLKRYKSTFPPFVQEDLHAGRTTQHFDSKEYIRRREAREAHLTILWGWPRRDTSLNHQTEFFAFYRTITFRWAQSILREHIISEINLLFKRLKIESVIEIHGIPTPASILETRQKMVDGSISFEEAYKKTSLIDVGNSVGE